MSLMNLVRREDPDHIGIKLGGQTKTDAFGCKRIFVYAVTAKLINTPYPLLYKAYGAEIAAIGAAGTDCVLVVPDKAIAASSYGWAALRGLHDVVVTGVGTAEDGEAIKIHTDGKPVSAETAWIDDVETNWWGVALEAKGTATAVTIKCFLTGREVTWV